MKTMSKFLSLIKVQLKSQWRLSLARYAVRNDKKSLLKGIGLALVVLMSVGMLVFSYSFFISKVYEACKAMNLQRLVLSTGAMTAGMFTLFFGILFILGSLFLAKDIQFLSSLPLKPQSVFLSKFLIVLLEEYPVVLFFMVPPVIIFGVGEGMGAAYYLKALICILLAPLIPLVISALLSLALMGLVSQSRRRDMLITIGSVILIIIYFMGQFALVSKIPEDDPNFLIRLLQDNEGILELTGKRYPPALWITRALTGPDSAINLLLIVAASAVALGLVYALASLIYRKGAAAQLEARKRFGKTRLQYRVSSPIIVFFKNEWRSLLRTPVYALNALIMVFIGPLLMSMPLFGGNLANDPDLEALYSMITGPETQAYLPFVLAALLVLVSVLNPATATSISREGEAFQVLKTIPVAPYKQVFGKLLAGYSISFITCVATAVVTALSFRLSLFAVLFGALLGSIALITTNALGILFDLIRPNLRWVNPQQAIKQNFNVMIGAFAGLAYAALVGLIAYLLLGAGVNITVVSLLTVLILLASAGGSLILLYRVSSRYFKRIEL